MLHALPLVLAAGAGLAGAKTYNLYQTSAGASFFDNWVYPGTYDTTNNAPTPDSTNSGDNWLANKTYSQSAGLTTVNDAGHAILKVDDTSTVVYNDKRYSVRIESAELFPVGTVFVLDAVHIPFGCSVWPAYWMSGTQWPEGGEIDVIENVNQATNNQMALHTHGTCTIPRDSTTMTGSVVFEDCGDSLNGNTGCVVRDPSDRSFGKGFNENQGGMWVTEFAEEGISIWFFQRTSIPEGLRTEAGAQSVDTATFGTPVAHYPAANCNIAELFAPQKVIINISLCGNFARPTFGATCPETRENSCYLDWVIGDPARYREAYYEIVSHRVFSDGARKPDTNPDTGSGTGGDGSSGGGSGGNGNGTGNGNGNGNNGGNNGLGGGNGNGGNGATSRWSLGGVSLAPVFLAAAALF